MLAFYSLPDRNSGVDGIDFALNWLSENGESLVDEDLPMKVVVCARYDLNMSAGKLAAQVGHAIHTLCRDSDEEIIEEWEWEDSASKIVVLGVKDELELAHMITRAESLGVGAFSVEDAGRTEVDPGTLTVAAIGPCYEELIDLITGSLRPYKVPSQKLPIAIVPE